MPDGSRGVVLRAGGSAGGKARQLDDAKPVRLCREPGAVDQHAKGYLVDPDRHLAARERLLPSARLIVDDTASGEA